MTYEVKDSGTRTTFDSGMERDGGGTNKTDYMLCFDGPMFVRWAEHLTKGARKYTKRNWMQANSQAEIDHAMESLGHHFIQYIRGDTDEDHAAAVFFNINLIEYVKERTATLLPAEIQLKSALAAASAEIAQLKNTLAEKEDLIRVLKDNCEIERESFESDQKKIELLQTALGQANADLMGCRDGALVRDLRAENERLIKEQDRWISQAEHDGKRIGSLRQHLYEAENLIRKANDSWVFSGTRLSEDINKWLALSARRIHE